MTLSHRNCNPTASSAIEQANPVRRRRDDVVRAAKWARERINAATVIVVEIVRKLPDQASFPVLPRRWVGERFFAWIGRNRGLAKDFEATIASARAFLYAASVMLIVRRMARAS